MVRIFLIVVLVHIFSLLNGQDIQFSQYYNLPQLMNPSLVGTSYAFRGMAHARLQWPTLQARYTTFLASADYNWSKYNSGIGISFLNDAQGPSYITTNSIAAQYAYWVNITKDISLRSGIQLAQTWRSIEVNKFTFPNQFDGNGFNSAISPGFDGNTLNTSFFSIASGLVLYTKEFWVGAAGYNLNRPNQTFLGEKDLLPMKFNFVAGYRIILKKIPTMRYLEDEDEIYWTLTPTVHFKTQGTSQQLDLGIYSIYKFLLTGLWYRGIPVKNVSPYINNESLILIGGFKQDNFSVTYSYDFVISGLGAYSGGAHEINLTYLYPKRKNFKGKNVRFKRLPCPDFD